MVASRDIKCGEVISEEKGAICVLLGGGGLNFARCITYAHGYIPQTRQSFFRFSCYEPY